MTDRTIALVGAGGVTGGPVIRAFQTQGARVRAIARSAELPGRFPDTVETRLGDLTNIDQLEHAVRGAFSIHYIPPSFDPAEETFARNLVAAAERAGVSRIVYHSVLHAMTPDMPHHHRKARVELLLRQSTLKWTILQPAMYAQTVLAFFDTDASELTPAFDVRRLFAPLHDEDLAEASAIVHMADGHGFATYELAGPHLLDFVGMASRLGEVLGRKILARQVTADVLAPRVAVARSFTADQARELRLMFEHYDAHGLVGNGMVLRMILGREPTEFGEAMRRSLGLFAADPGP